MRRFYLLIVLCLLISGATMAQFAQLPQHKNTLRKTTDGISSVVKHYPAHQRENVIWSCDFENGSPEPFLSKTDDSEVIWEVITESDYPDEMYRPNGSCYFLPMNYSGHGNNTDPHQQISETPDHWAFVDAGSDRYNTAPQINTSMTFSNIDLSACAKPKVTFLQSWKELNSTKEQISVETSTDGGATWTTHIVNDEDVPSYTYVNGYKEVLIPEVGNNGNVTLRFSYTSESGTWNYGWQIDDIKIVEIPEHNLTINNGRMNFWGYKDYTDPEQLAQYTGTMDPATFYYQYNDPYAQTPRQNWVNAQSEFEGYIIFNVELTNNGYATVTPQANIKVTSPSGEIIFNRTLAADRVLAMGETDTIDFYTANEDIFSFGVTDPEDIEVGRYTVTFSVSTDGAEDVTPDDNSKESFFDITDGNYAMVYDEPDMSFGMSQYTSSASGEEIAEEFYYFYLPDDEMNVDVFVSSGSTPNTSKFVLKIYEINEESNDWQIRLVSDAVMTTESMINTWTTVQFQDPYYIDAFDPNYKSKSLMVGIVSYYDDADAKLYYGSNGVLPSFHHNVLGRSADEEEFGGYGYPPVALRLHKKNETAVESVSMNGINMYPNPSNGIVNFSNVENATIEVYNMMGQVVASESNVNDNASIDLSGVANGNYIVRIVKNGEIATSKLSIVK